MASAPIVNQKTCSIFLFWLIIDGLLLIFRENLLLLSLGPTNIHMQDTRTKTGQKLFCILSRFLLFAYDITRQIMWSLVSKGNQLSKLIIHM